jgi:CubicO group peptidase (beta-lactamase class C family)
VLRTGSPREAGLREEHVARLVPVAEERLGRDYPGFVLLAARDGVIVTHAARGWAVRWRGERVPMRPDTVFDIASLTKLFTAVVVARLAERGVLDLDAPVGRYLPGFRPVVPVWRLLTHTAGLPPWADLGPYPDNAARLAAIGEADLAYPPGTGYAYSDLGLIAAGAVAEAAAGRPLDELVAAHVTRPLGLADTGFTPPPALLPRIAATEYQPGTGRGLVRGEVHDENAYYLGGVAGHAGIFSTAADLAALAQAMLNGGRLGERRLLSEEWTRRVLTNHNAGLGPAAARGLGWQLDQPWYMDALASPGSFGHTGFTGTSLVADPRTGSLLVLLTNRVHPSRERGTDSAYRRAPARVLARAAGLPVPPGEDP